jgi:hypothetical protein
MGDTELLDAQISPPPAFPESISELALRVSQMVGKVVPPRDLRAPHGLVTKLLRADEERQLKGSQLLDRPLFSSPFEQRRLRILSAIFSALGRCGMRGTLGGKDPSDFGVWIGEQHVSFALDHPGRRGRFGYRSNEELRWAASKTLKLAIAAPSRKEIELRTVWEDRREAPVETHVTEIVVNLILIGELRYRLSEEYRHEALIDRRERLIEERMLREQKAERMVKEERMRAQQKRVERLLRDADALRRAQDIRIYIAQVRELESRHGSSSTSAELDEWTAWASEQADKIDPVRLGSYLSAFDGRSEEE